MRYLCMAQDFMRDPSGSPSRVPVRDRVASAWDRLSEGERRIADRLAEATGEVAYASATQLGRELALSSSTVVRFAQKLGFRGWPDMQAALRRDAGAHHRMTGLPPQADDFLDGYVETEMANVAYLRSQTEALDTAGRVLADAPRVWTLGDRTTFWIAGLGTHMLRMIRPDVQQLSIVPGDVPDRLLDVREGDVVLAVSMSRYARRTDRVVRALAERARIVLLTDEHASPLAPLADPVVRFGTRGVTGLRSDVGATATMQALILTVARRRPDATDRLDSAEALWDAFEVFA